MAENPTMGWLMTTILANESRRAEIDGPLVTLYRNSGKVRDTWVQIWPAFDADKLAKRIANAWVNRAKIVRMAV